MKSMDLYAGFKRSILYGCSLRFGLFRLLLLVPWWFGAQACEDEPDPIVQYSFERPSSVALVCFEVSTSKGKSINKPRPIKDCKSDNNTTHHLHALVAQTSRGEVAAVDLEEREVIDSRPDIPGYTFVMVGEVPKTVVVPENHPDMTYIANFGSRNVTWMPTKAFRAEGFSQAILGRHVSVGGGPMDMVVSPDEKYLFVVVPDRSAIVRLSLCRGSDEDDSDCTEGSITDIQTLTLPPYTYQSLRQIQASLPADAYLEPQEYKYSCGYQFDDRPIDFSYRDFSKLFSCSEESPIQDVATDATVIVDSSTGSDARVADEVDTTDASIGEVTEGRICDSLAPKPIALTVDIIDDHRYRLLAGDQALPVIHVIELDSEEPERFTGLVNGEQTLPEPIVTGVPIKDIVVTPVVPKIIPSSYSPTQPSEVLDGAVNTEDDMGTDAGMDAEIDTGIPADASGEFSVDGGSDADLLEAVDDEPVDESDIPFEGVKYIYAIDDTDGSVLVVDAQTHAVLTINSQQSRHPDRIELYDSVAQVLEVITPDYDRSLLEEEETAHLFPFFSTCICNKFEDEEIVPITPRLHGVFLVVVSSDGIIRIVDIHDMRAIDLKECRHTACVDANNQRLKKRDEDGKVIKDNQGNDELVLDSESFAGSYCVTDGDCIEGQISRNDLTEKINEEDSKLTSPLSPNCTQCCVYDEDEQMSSEMEYDWSFQEGEAVDSENTYEKEGDAFICEYCQSENGQPIPFTAENFNKCTRCVDQEGNDINVAIRRHYPRLFSLRSSPAPSLDNIQFLLNDTTILSVDDDGVTRGQKDYSLLRIQCEQEQGWAQSFPNPDEEIDINEDTESPSFSIDTPEEVDGGVVSDSDSGVILKKDTEKRFVYQEGTAYSCIRTDPWRANGEDWWAIYEGSIPGTSGTVGKFIPPSHPENLSGELEFNGSGAFCRSGVLGSEDVVPKLIFITSELPTEGDSKSPSTINKIGASADEQSEDCLTGENPDRDCITFQDCASLEPPIAFLVENIKRENGSMELKPFVVFTELPVASEDAFEFVRYCMGEPSHVYTYQVATDLDSLIPGLSLSRGHFLEADGDNTDTFEFVGESVFAPSGDILVITSLPQPTEVIEKAVKSGIVEKKKFRVKDCESLAEFLSEEQPPRLAFRIKRAYKDHLVIEENLIREPNNPVYEKLDQLPHLSYEFLNFCAADMLMSFEVHSYQSYVVRGSASSFLSDVSASEEGRCRPGNRPLQNGRAFAGIEYRNPTISFKIADVPEQVFDLKVNFQVKPIIPLQTNIGTLGGFSDDIGNLPINILYDRFHKQLLIVDMSVRGLALIPVNGDGFPIDLAGTPGVANYR